MTDLFVYGALMFDEVWNHIVSGDFQKSKAHITGYRRLAVKDDEYPGLVEGSGTVSGFIWHGVDNKNLEYLDDFEGEYYARIPVKAIVESGQTVEVNVYYFKKEFHHLLEKSDWDVNKFKSSGLKEFIKRYAGYDRIK